MLSKSLSHQLSKQLLRSRAAAAPTLRVITKRYSSTNSILKKTATAGANRGLATSVSGITPSSSNPPMAFPCLDRHEKRTQSFESGPEPAYSYVQSGFELYKSTAEAGPLFLDNGGVLYEFELAYETWGTLNADKSNAILIHTGLSASSHAKSHPNNSKPGWWEKFIGPGLSIDTNKFFVVCTNVIGGCYGSTGPSSIDPFDGDRYATRFPIVTVNDMVRAQHRLIRSHLGIKQLYASVGASMGGMQSLAFATEFPESVNKVVSISGCARSHPYSIAMRHTQRQVLMADPNWKRGFYYDGVPPHVGMKLAREIATITYRSGPEWEERFGRDRADPSKTPALCPDFLIETYLDHAGEKFCLEYDPNSLLYVSKAMDLFDLGVANRARAQRHIAKATDKYNNSTKTPTGDSALTCSLPTTPYKEQPRAGITEFSKQDLVDGMRSMANHEVLVLGVDSDILFPSWQQREIADMLKAGSDHPECIEYIELGQDISLFGHDTFLLDVDHIGGPMKRFLERS